MPECQITLTTPFPDLDRSAYNGARVVRCSRREPRKAGALVLRALCWHAASRLIGKDLSRLLDDELRVYRESDVVVDLSGDGLTEEYGVKCLISHLVPMVLGKLLRRPVFLCAQTIGPLRRTELLCRWLLKKADRISARDGLTFDYLRGMGVNSARLSRTADLAFLTANAPVARARQILAQEGVPLDKPLAGISVSRLPGHRLGIADSRKAAALEIEMSKSLDRLVEIGLRPVFVSHATGPGLWRDDRRTAYRVVDLMQYGSEAAVLSGDYSVEETKAVIGQMDIFVGVRMHSCISAMSMGVPTISVAYGPKAYGIMALAGQERWVLDITQVTGEKLFALIREAWESKSGIRDSLRDRMSRVLALAEENVAIVMEMLGVRDASRAEAAGEGPGRGT